ncbi:MAG: glucokinase, partial [Beijerinckiaceae bacterium]|nr:glucokinase [Beijerinckiaceae bacterium]
PHGPEAATLHHCWNLVARFEGDLALAFLAKGGVSSPGGILPSIADFCDPGKFHAAFEYKTPYGELPRVIGSHLIIAGDTVFSGMAAIASPPRNYSAAYARRIWRWSASQALARDGKEQTSAARTQPRILHIVASARPRWPAGAISARAP